MAASEAAIEITLRCSDRLDEYNTRTFGLRPGAVVHIGRASKNAAKPELMSGSGNAYIDSPTISREHAVLTATSPPAACVYITDKASMHGTMVNGTKLEPQKPHRLHNGDVLQFGANVTREQLFYTARQFTFESSLPTYPHGFTVPESSDEEDVEVDEGLSCPPQYGSQTNPFTIDDIDESHPSEVDELAEAPEVCANVSDDDESDDDELDKALQETTIPLDGSPDPETRSPSPHVHDHVFYAEDVSTAFPASGKYAFVEDASSEGDVTSIYSSDDEGVSHGDSCASVAHSDESQSDGDMELEDHDDDEEEEVAAPLPIPMQLMLLEQQNRKRVLMAAQERANHQNASEASENRTDSSASPEKKEVLVGDPTKDTDIIRSDSSELGAASPLAPFVNPSSAIQTATAAEPPKMPEPELRFEPFFNSNGVFGNSFDRACFDHMEAMPPRPAAPRPMQWGMLDYMSPFSPPTNTPAFPATYSSDLLGTYSGTVEPVLPNPYVAQPPFLTASDNTWEPSKNSATATVSGVQTPPPAPSSETSSPPVRRTEVSIREIVEDVTQQPPTPTSVTGGLKRKAEVLDESVEAFGEEPTPTPQSPFSIDNSDAPDAPAVEIADSHTTVDQRPKKRLRSRIGGAVKTVAAWMVPGVVGAAASVAFLTSVPNDFFVA